MRPEAFTPLSSEDASYLLNSLDAPESPLALSLPYWSSEKRAGALALICFIEEMRMLPARVTDAMLGAIRQQWWRDAIAEIYGKGQPRAHPLVNAMAQTLADTPDLRSPLERLIDQTGELFEATDPTDLDEAITLCRLQGGPAFDLLSQWAAPDLPEATLEEAQTLGMLWWLGEAASAPSPLEKDVSTIQPIRPRIRRWYLKHHDLGEARRKYVEATKSFRHWPDSLAPIQAILSPGNAWLAGTRPGPLRLRMRAFWAVLRGR